MIQTLLKSLRRGAKPPPVGSRIYAISDIHRRAGLLARLHRVILADADAPAAGPAADPARRDEDLMWIRDDFLDSTCQVLEGATQRYPLRSPASPPTGR
jgi:hypothetical protein